MRGLLLSCILVVALAQHVNAQIAPHHHWIGFESKVGCGVDLADPNAGLALLSQRALDRRDKQGISLDSTDLPIPPHLVDDVLSLGISDAGQAIKMLHRSRGSMASSFKSTLPWLIRLKPRQCSHKSKTYLG